MKESASDAIDELVTKIRLTQLKFRESDPETTADLKSLLTQLEDWVENLVMDSLKLESLEKELKKKR